MCIWAQFLVLWHNQHVLVDPMTPPLLFPNLKRCKTADHTSPFYSPFFQDQLPDLHRWKKPGSRTRLIGGCHLWKTYGHSFASQHQAGSRFLCGSVPVLEWVRRTNQVDWRKSPEYCQTWGNYADDKALEPCLKLVLCCSSFAIAIILRIFFLNTYQCLSIVSQFSFVFWPIWSFGW